jgi:hypothetical protein
LGMLGLGVGMGWLGLGRWLESVLGLATVLFQPVVVRQPGLPRLVLERRTQA